MAINNGGFSLLHSTLLAISGTGGTALSVGNASAQDSASQVTAISQVSGPDGSNNYTYRLTNTTGSFGEDAYYLIGGLSGSSAALNALEVQLFNVDNTAKTADFYVSAALNPPATTTLTGLTFGPIPKLIRLDGNLLSGPTDVLLVVNGGSLINAYGKNYLKDTNTTNQRLVALLITGPTVRYTAAQATSTTQSAGNLNFDTGGKLGGSGWFAEFSGTSARATTTISSLVVSNGLVTATATSHPYVSGQRVLITGATPDQMNGWQFVTKVDANTFTYTAPRGLTDQAATGSIDSTDGTPRAGSTAFGNSPTYDLGGLTTDIHGHLIPASGRNFGAVQ